MRCLNTNKLLTRKVITISETPKINFEVNNLMYKCTDSQQCAVFNNYFRLITDVHLYNQDKSKLVSLLCQKHVETRVQKF